MLFSPWRIELAIREDDLEFFREFYESGEWFRLGPEGVTALLYLAAEFSARSICLFLLENGADVNASYNGFTALCGAAAGGDADVVGDLLRYGAKIDGNPDTVCPPLLTAIQHGRTGAALRLLEAGADVDRCQLWSGESALDLARRFRRITEEAALLERGAKNTYELPPCSEEGERALLAYLLGKTKRMLLEQKEFLTIGGLASLRSTMVPGKQKKLLFTWGVSRHTAERIELCAEMPMAWRFSSPEPREQLTMTAVLCCARMLVSGTPLRPGDRLTPHSEGCAGLPWTSPRMFLRISSPAYFGDSWEKAGVRFLSVAPAYPRKAVPERQELYAGP